MVRAVAGFLTGAAVLVLVCGCGGGDSFRDSDRAARLMAMAGEEAGQIDSPSDSLARQLQIADMQNDRGRHADARKTLASAVETLRTAPAGALELGTRLAGWVSVSELSRGADDRRTAEAACDEALRILRNDVPPVQRPQFVRSLAVELRELRGKPAAAALLREAGPWASAVQDEDERRQAYRAIASDLFLYDDYAGGQAVLRQDEDAVWRTDTLLALARRAVPQESYGSPLQFNKVFMMGVYKGK